MFPQRNQTRHRVKNYVSQILSQAIPTCQVPCPCAQVSYAILIAEMLPLFRIGHGYDIHPFAPGRPLWLGGVHFPDSPLGLAGHSDADVLLHALCDALLGAAGLGDIGTYFPPSDMRHKDRPSIEFVAEVRTLLAERGWQIGNIDITVIAETPKIGPRADEMKAVIAAALQLSVDAVGIKATTNEGLGFVGRREGICAHAVALLCAESH
jgi:2-C-methyl-D-erythritol 2,4-cyclodiphosphate synthase